MVKIIPEKDARMSDALILLVVRNILLSVNLPKSSAVEAQMFVFLQPDTDGTCIDWAVELNPGANFKRRSEKGQNNVSLRHKGILHVSNPLHWLHTEQQKKRYQYSITYWKETQLKSPQKSFNETNIFTLGWCQLLLLRWYQFYTLIVIGNIAFPVIPLEYVTKKL